MNSLRALLSLLLAVAPLNAQPAALQLSRLAERLQTSSAPDVLRQAFDGAAAAPVEASDAGDYRRLQQARQLLSLGTPQPGGAGFGPFTFNTRSGAHTAPAAGLEGFVYAEAKLAEAQGRTSLQHHLDDYGRYLDALLAPIEGAQDARREASASCPPELPAVRYDRLMAFTRSIQSCAASGRQRQSALGEVGAHLRDLPRAYNLAGKRAAMGRPAGPGSVLS